MPPKEVNGKLLEFEPAGMEDRVFRLEEQVGDLRQEQTTTGFGLTHLAGKIDEKFDALNGRLDKQDAVLEKTGQKLDTHEKILEDLQLAKKKKAERAESWKKWIALFVTAGVGALVKELAVWLLK